MKQIGRDITHLCPSPPIPSPPTPVLFLHPHHIASHPLKSAMIRAHNIPECDYAYSIVRNVNDWNSLPMRLSNIMTRLVIKEDACNNMKGDVVIDGLDCLKNLLVQKNSMQNVNCLKICNCAMLETIETESEAFKNVKSVELSSLLDCIQLI